MTPFGGHDLTVSHCRKTKYPRDIATLVLGTVMVKGDAAWFRWNAANVEKRDFGLSIVTAGIKVRSDA